MEVAECRAFKCVMKQSGPDILRNLWLNGFYELDQDVEIIPFPWYENPPSSFSSNCWKRLSSVRFFPELHDSSKVFDVVPVVLHVPNQFRIALVPLGKPFHFHLHLPLVHYFIFIPDREFQDPPCPPVTVSRQRIDEFIHNSWEYSANCCAGLSMFRKLHLFYQTAKNNPPYYIQYSVGVPPPHAHSSWFRLLHFSPIASMAVVPVDVLLPTLPFTPFEFEVQPEHVSVDTVPPVCAPLHQSCPPAITRAVPRVDSRFPCTNASHDVATVTLVSPITRASEPSPTFAGTIWRSESALKASTAWTSVHPREVTLGDAAHSAFTALSSAATFPSVLPPANRIMGEEVPEAGAGTAAHSLGRKGSIASRSESASATVVGTAATASLMH